MLFISQPFLLVTEIPECLSIFPKFFHPLGGTVGSYHMLKTFGKCLQLVYGGGG